MSLVNLKYTNLVLKPKRGMSVTSDVEAAIIWFVWVWSFVYNLFKQMEKYDVRFKKRLGNQSGKIR